MTSNGISITDLNYDDRSGADFITVDAVPERRGVLIKTVEYAVTSKRFSSQVHRRYKDFLVFRELLLLRFSYRIIPTLPPKKISIVVDSDHVEERRKAFQRFLNILAHHPAMGSDILVKYFLTVQERDIYQTMKNHFATLSDEFFVHPTSLEAMTLIHESATRDYKKHRENINQILIAISKLHDLLSHRVRQFEAEANNLREVDKLLKELVGSAPSAPSSPRAANENSTPANGKHLLSNIPKWLTESEQHMVENACANVSKITPRFTAIAATTTEKARSEENSVIDKLQLIIDVINGYQELSQRHEKGVTGEHHRAIRQLNNLKKLTSGATPGLAESPQNLEAIEQTVNQREAEIATIEQRNAFALYCVQEETRLVYCYMALLNGIFVDLASANVDSLGELSTIWREIRSCATPQSKDNRSISTTPARKPLTGSSGRK